MAMVVKRPKLSLAEQFYLLTIAAGLAITLKHLRKLVSGKTKVTMQYPKQRWDVQLPPWFAWPVSSVNSSVHHAQPQSCPKKCPLGSLGKGREAPQRVRDRHDPLHLLRLVRRGVPRAGHLPQEGILDLRVRPAKSNNREKLLEMGGVMEGWFISGTKRNSPVRLMSTERPPVTNIIFDTRLFWSPPSRINTTPVVFVDISGHYDYRYATTAKTSRAFASSVTTRIPSPASKTLPCLSPFR
jgi:hypothetical protein